MSVPHAEVLFLHELAAAQDIGGRYVRTTGEVSAFDVASHTCVISHKGASFAVDVELIRSPITLGGMYQVFGEVQHIGARVRAMSPRQ